MIKGASEEILEAQYCAAGDHQGWLVHCGMKKLRSNRVEQITDDERQAMIAASNSLRDKGGSDGSF